MVAQNSVKELFVPVLKISQVHVTVDGFFERAQIFHKNFRLQRLSPHGWCKETLESKFDSFFLRKSQILSGKGQKRKLSDQLEGARVTSDTRKGVK